MRRLHLTAFGWMVFGVASGLFYREFTKLNDWPEGKPTQLGLVHTHTLVLGFLLLLVVMLLEKVFVLSRSRAFEWFFWLHNVGLAITAGAMIWHGCLTVVGRSSTPMIAGIAGLGHMTLTAGMVLLFLALGAALKRDEKRASRAV